MSIPERLISEAGSANEAEFNQMVVAWGNKTVRDLKLSAPKDRGRIDQITQAKLQDKLWIGRANSIPLCKAWHLHLSWSRPGQPWTIAQW